MSSINGLIGHLEDANDCKLAHFSESPEPGSWAAGPGVHELIRESRSVVRESVPLSVVDLQSLEIWGVEGMTRVSIPEMLFGALVSTLLSNNTRTGELESRLASKNSQFEAVAAGLEPFERRLLSAGVEVRFMQEQN